MGRHVANPDAPDEQALKCAVAPDVFSALDNAWGRRGWTCATLAALSETELKAGAGNGLAPRGAEGQAEAPLACGALLLRLRSGQRLALGPQPLRRRVVLRRR